MTFQVSLSLLLMAGNSYFLQVISSHCLFHQSLHWVVIQLPSGTGKLTACQHRSVGTWISLWGLKYFFLRMQVYVYIYACMCVCIYISVCVYVFKTHGKRSRTHAFQEDAHITAVTEPTPMSLADHLEISSHMPKVEGVCSFVPFDRCSHLRAFTQKLALF